MNGGLFIQNAAIQAPNISTLNDRSIQNSFISINNKTKIEIEFRQCIKGEIY